MSEKASECIGEYIYADSQPGTVTPPAVRGWNVKLRVTETGIVLERNICVLEIDERKNRRVSRCFMHPAQQESDRAGGLCSRRRTLETHKYSADVRAQGGIRVSVRPKVPCWQVDFEFSYPGDRLLSRRAKGPGFTETFRKIPHSRVIAKHAPKYHRPAAVS